MKHLGLQRQGSPFFDRAPSKTIKVLVVGALNSQLTHVSSMMADWKWKVTHAKDYSMAQEAVSRLQVEKDLFDLILLDIGESSDDLKSIEDWISSVPGLAKVTLLLLPSSSSHSMAASVEEPGYLGYVMKPVTRGSLFSKVPDSVRGTIPLTAKPFMERQQAESNYQQSLDILLVEDNSVNQLLIKTYLKDTPHRLEIASNGQIAVERVKTMEFDLIFMDVQMPIMDGHTATRLIRQWEQVHSRNPVSIIALTAHALAQDIQENLEAGCVGQLSKPISKDDLLSTIARFSSGDEKHLRGLLTELQSTENREIPMDPDLVDLLPSYILNRWKDLNACRAALPRGDFETIQQLMHSMAGSGESFGLRKLTDIGRLMEKAVKDRNAEAIRYGLDSFATYLNTLDIPQS